MKEEDETEETTVGALSQAELWGERAESIVRYVTNAARPMKLQSLLKFMYGKGWHGPMAQGVLEYIESQKLLVRFTAFSGEATYKLPMTRVTESGDDYVTGAIEKATETAAAKQAQAVRAQRIREFATRKKTPPAPPPSIGGWRARNKVAAPAVVDAAAVVVEPEPVPAPPAPTPLPEAPAEPVVKEEPIVTKPSEDTIDSSAAAARLGITITAFNSRVSRRGVKPASIGSGRGSMSMYRVADVEALASRKGGSGRPAKVQRAARVAKPAKAQRAPKPAAVTPTTPEGLDKVRLLISCVDAGIFSRDDAWERLRTLVAA